MTEQTRTEGWTQESQATGGRIRRRGMIAGAAALVAGVVAQRTAQPVAAALNNVVYSTSTAVESIHFPAAPIFFQSASPFSTTFPPQIIQVVAESAGVDAILGNAGGGRHGVVGQGGDGAIGVYGSASNGTGVFGQTTASNQYGVLGGTNAPNSTAVAGACNGNGSSAFSGGTTNPSAYAGVFQGNVVIQGKLVVSDPSYKSGALQHPDGSTRLVYCVESPESWIEDVGAATLTGGKATVTFDKDFAAVTQTDTYHIFLTPYGDSKGLYVTNKSAAGFEVHEQQGGTSTLGFSWKVMVKAKSGVKSERLGKFTMPNLPLPDPSKFKMPELPTPKKP